MNPLGAPGDRREQDLGRGHCEVGAVVLADADEIDAQFIGQHSLVDHVPEHLRMRQQVALRIRGDVAERIKPEFKMLCHALFCSVWSRPGWEKKSRPEADRWDCVS